ncbi:hypothetical protein BVRB_029930, partial [Beta vulgaris subsp. vulgaris]
VAKAAVITRTLPPDGCQHPVIALSMSNPKLVVVFASDDEVWRKEFSTGVEVVFVVDEGMAPGDFT